MLEGVAKNIRDQRLQELATILTAVPAAVSIHLEVARFGSAAHLTVAQLGCSIADKVFIADIFTILLPHVDSLGLNEQELAAFVLANNG